MTMHQLVAGASYPGYRIPDYTPYPHPSRSLGGFGFGRAPYRPNCKCGGYGHGPPRGGRR